MNKINLLSSKIFNRIAAGEVVENPASVVKELVENSIDAGATKINVEIVDGGITKIKVSDNGLGIYSSELKKALLPHATSKISKLEDLDKISTFGFRGEALASISSISKLQIISKTFDSEVGYSISSYGGEISNVTEYPSTNGTEIIVENLFFNTPAREKFLKKPKSEENSVTNIVAKLILGNYDVAFNYIADGKEIYKSYGDGLESAICSIYGEKTISECFFIDTIKNGLKIKGYVGKHHFTKPNKTYQSIFINNRFVQNQTIGLSIYNAYSSYLMKRQYPFYVLHLEIPYEFIDVNVHPNKTDVRFSNNEIIYGSFYSVISKVLDGTSEAINIIKDNNSTINYNENIDNSIKHNDDFNVKPGFKNLVFNDVSVDKEHNSNDNSIFEENKAYLLSLEKKKSEQDRQDNLVQQKLDIKIDLKYVGQALNTYLIFEYNENVLFVDQHAMHERLLYDKLIKKLNDNELDIQPLLIPYVLELNAVEYDFISSKIQTLRKLGLEIEEFGSFSYKISALPALLSEISLDDFFKNLINDANQLNEIKLEQILKEKIAQKACKSAIKAGYVISSLEIETIKKYLSTNLGLKCPHGRPVCTIITKTEIEKWFKRIV